MSVKVNVRPNASKKVYEFQVRGTVIAGAEGRWWLSSVSTRFSPEVAVKRIMKQFGSGKPGDSGPEKPVDVAVRRLPFDDVEPGVSGGLP